MVKARKYVVKRKFEGMPKREDFEVVEYELPALKEGELLVKAEWLSVDPYLRVINTMIPVPHDQQAFQVAEVIQSKDSKYPVGTWIVNHQGWSDYSIVRMDGKNSYLSWHNWQTNYKLPDLKGLSRSLGVGAIGMPGASAYVGILEGCQPKSGDTVAVTGAAGAVGSLVGQIAKVKGCRVIGFAGSDDKVKWLKELGFDHAFNYKTVDVPKALKEAAPNGIDCYFDNVGGEISSQIMYQMNLGGRVAVCGSISSYNQDLSELPKVTTVQFAIVSKGLTVRAFNVFDWEKKYWDEAFKQLTEWIKSGQIKAKEHVTEGFDNVFDAFVGMLKGENFGKAVVKV